MRVRSYTERALSNRGPFLNMTMAQQKLKMNDDSQALRITKNTHEASRQLGGLMLVSPVMRLTVPMQKAGGEPTSTGTKRRLHITDE